MLLLLFMISFVLFFMDEIFAVFHQLGQILSNYWAGKHQTSLATLTANQQPAVDLSSESEGGGVEGKQVTSTTQRMLSFKSD